MARLDFVTVRNNVSVGAKLDKKKRVQFYHLSFLSKKPELVTNGI